MRWLNRERAVAIGTVLLITEASLLIVIAARSHGMFGPVSPGSSDFLSFYATGTLANRGDFVDIYNTEVHQSVQREVYGDPNFTDGLFFFFYPPVFIILCSLLARLPYLVSIYLWAASTIALYLCSIQRILRDWGIAIGMLSCPALLLNVAVGQNAALTAGLFASGTILLDRRPAVAGAILGLLCYKPHFLIVIPIALLAARAWRAFFATCGGAIGLFALSWMLYGTACWEAFIRISAFSQRFFAEGMVGHWANASIFAAIRLLGGDEPLSYASQLIVGAIGVLLTSAIWYRRAALPERAAALIAAAMMFAPVIMSYDVLLGTVAMAWLAVSAKRSGWLPWEKASFAAIWLVMLTGRGIAEKFGIPVLPLIGPCLMILALRRHLSGDTRDNVRGGELSHSPYLQRIFTSASAR